MQLSCDMLLLAAADWWEVAIGVIFFVLYGIGQLMGAGENLKKKKAPKRQPPPRLPQPQARPMERPNAGAPANQADPLRAEVEEFLRRAQGKQAERRPAAQRTPPAKQAPPRRPLVEPADRGPAKPTPPPRRSPVVADAPAVVEVSRPESLAEHVARTVSSGVATHASTLGFEVARADDKLQARLQEKFQHQVGHLARGQQSPQKEQPPTIAEEIRQLISQPAGMRQLIIANEILRRPEERW